MKEEEMEKLRQNRLEEKERSQKTDERETII
jgi:hypothetical protein